MLPVRADLTLEETMVIDSLIGPYGVELNTSQLILKTDGRLKMNGLIHILDKLEMQGYLKGRNIVLTGYLVERRVYRINHSRVYRDSKSLLQTRMILSAIMNCNETV